MVTPAQLATATLEELLEATKDYVMSPDEAEEQRRSFAYGQLMLHNPDMTPEEGRALIARAAWQLDQGRLARARGWARRWHAAAKLHRQQRNATYSGPIDPSTLFDVLAGAVFPDDGRFKKSITFTLHRSNSPTVPEADERDAHIAALQKALGEAAQALDSSLNLIGRLDEDGWEREGVRRGREKAAAWRALASAGAASTGAEKEPI